MVLQRGDKSKGEEDKWVSVTITPLKASSGYSLDISIDKVYYPTNTKL